MRCVQKLHVPTWILRITCAHEKIECLFSHLRENNSQFQCSGCIFTFELVATDLVEDSAVLTLSYRLDVSVVWDGITPCFWYAWSKRKVMHFPNVYIIHYNTMYLYMYLHMYMNVYVDMFHSLVFLGQLKSIEKTRRRTLSCRWRSSGRSALMIDCSVDL